jgi:hypothetical protein
MVLAIHAAVIAALLMASAKGRLSGAPAGAVQLLYVAPVYPPKLQNVTASLPRRGVPLNLKIESPLMESLSLPLSQPHGSASDGQGTGVDWAAEARRALQAFEIRSHQPSSGKSVAGRPEDGWRPGAHYAGEKVKNANGDWIVWLNANCYEIATAGSGASAHVAPPAEPVCRDPAGRSTP